MGRAVDLATPVIARYWRLRSTVAASYMSRFAFYLYAVATTVDRLPNPGAGTCTPKSVDGVVQWVVG